MSPSSLPTIRASHALTLDGKKMSDQDHRVEDGSPFLDEKGYEVRLEPEDDPHQLSLCRRWLAVATISGASLCVACASSLASIHSSATRMQTSYLNYFCSLSGRFYCRRRGTTVSCRKRSSNPGNQLICHGPRHWSSPLRAPVRSVWPNHRLSCVVHPLFRPHVPRRFCPSHW